MTNQNTFLFRLASKSLKYFCLGLFGFAIAYVLSSALGVLHIMPIFVYLLLHVFIPLGIILEAIYKVNLKARRRELG